MKLRRTVKLVTVVAAGRKRGRTFQTPRPDWEFRWGKIYGLWAMGPGREPGRTRAGAQWLSDSDARGDLFHPDRLDLAHAAEVCCSHWSRGAVPVAPYTTGSAECFVLFLCVGGTCLLSLSFLEPPFSPKLAVANGRDSFLFVRDFFLNSFSISVFFGEVK